MPNRFYLKIGESTKIIERYLIPCTYYMLDIPYIFSLFLIKLIKVDKNSVLEMRLLRTREVLTRPQKEKVVEEIYK